MDFHKQVSSNPTCHQVNRITKCVGQVTGGWAHQRLNIHISQAVGSTRGLCIPVGGSVKGYLSLSAMRTADPTGTLVHISGDNVCHLVHGMGYYLVFGY